MDGGRRQERKERESCGATAPFSKGVTDVHLVVDDALARLETTQGIVRLENRLRAIQGIVVCCIERKLNIFESAARTKRDKWARHAVAPRRADWPSRLLSKLPIQYNIQ